MRGQCVLFLVLAGCAAGKFHDEVTVDGHVLREGMSEKEIADALRTPDSVTTGAHQYAYEFRDTGRRIAPSWKECVWYGEDKNMCVAYVSDGVVQRVGVIIDSPPPPPSAPSIR